MDATHLGLLLVLVSMAAGQYSEQGQGPVQGLVGSTPRPSAILQHQQALAHDGAFRFAFAADNGLRHGETIAPDGSRSGAYSYIDPHGKTISVKYSAGKEGFRILQDDHVPRAPPTHPQHAAYHPAPQPPPPPPPPPPPQPPLDRYFSYRPTAAPVHGPDPGLSANTIQPEPEYNDEPGKPHSFGNGYAFAFSG